MIRTNDEHLLEVGVAEIELRRSYAAYRAALRAIDPQVAVVFAEATVSLGSALVVASELLGSDSDPRRARDAA